MSSVRHGYRKPAGYTDTGIMGTGKDKLFDTRGHTHTRIH
jgi:hypothetical protein